jgi:hypothetical protein
MVILVDPPEAYHQAGLRLGDRHLKFHEVRGNL